MRHPAAAGVAIVLIACAGPAMAASTQSSKSACWAEGGTLQIANCFASSAGDADAQLNALYARIQSVLEADDKTRLQVAERRWIAYRDAMCDAEHALWGGGTGGSPAYLACMDDETRHHLDYLQTTYRLRLQKLDLPGGAQPRPR